jgi:hypothetical protein
MALDAPVPDPPALSPAVDPDEYEDAEVAGDADDYRRAEIADALAAGAWADAFEAWAAEARVDETDWGIVRDLDLLAEFDFFWDGFAGRIGYHAPGLPEDWQERELHPDLDSWGRVSGINAGLTELGQTVCDVVEAEYVDWEADYEPPDDLPEF